MSNDNKLAPAAPVTDAEIEASGDARFKALTALSDNEDPADSDRLLREVTRTRAAFNSLIARRVQQATAAAEELARAAEAAWEFLDAHFGAGSGDTSEWCKKHKCPEMLSSDEHLERWLRTALAAFRAAQGGGK